MSHGPGEGPRGLPHPWVGRRPPRGGAAALRSGLYQVLPLAAVITLISRGGGGKGDWRLAALAAVEEEAAETEEKVPSEERTSCTLTRSLRRRVQKRNGSVAQSTISSNFFYQSLMPKMMNI